jgi:hypothetical protein
MYSKRRSKQRTTSLNSSYVFAIQARDKEPNAPYFRDARGTKRHEKANAFRALKKKENMM